MHPTGTKFKTADGCKWEIIQVVKDALGNLIYYYCICKDKPKHDFQEFTEKKMEGVEFI